ncbi:flagellar assembly protein FliH [Lacimicrobium alkaliphilum]|uniref:Flagellar assembly protein FliH n=1 Tax=Lacimicrobium alkaliphilum TaxID=1526571 RepID=A0A0U3BBK3_9ALTE|nr:flagellar assembly protein FliH [Lacimicrobium alkaliphilum]ALS99029.1 flagellar assembly protein FliH [Lacimicrobium alkaliphilum]
MTYNKDSARKDTEQVRSWELPFVEDETETEPDKTNALNRTSGWKYEPPEVEEEVLPPTAKEIEEIRHNAWQEGFEQGRSEGFDKGHQQGLEQGLAEGTEQGLEQGKSEGLAAGKEQVDERVSAWQQLIEQLVQPVEQVDAQLEKELVQLAVSLARAVIRTEVQTNEKVIFQALSEGLKVLPVQDKGYQIHLHPEDIQLIREHFSEQEIESHHWQLIETPDMTRGGCDIVTQNNAVDVSVERRARQVLDKFLLEQGLSAGSKQQD